MLSTPALFRLFAIFAFAVGTVSALSPRAGHSAPDNDPFFTPHKGWENRKPGDILRTRSFKAKFFGTGFNVKEAYQILYRTSHNTADEPSYTVTTVLVPYNAKPDILVVLSEAQDANGPQCRPSQGYESGSLESLGFVLDEAMFLPYLNEGYIVTVPDHEGPLDAFAAGRMEGHMTLDSIRATLNFDKLNLSKNSKVAGYGYSGGALNLGWASSLKRVYAPELNVVGWAFGGTPANLSSTMDMASGTAFAGFVASGVVGVLDAYPEVKKQVVPYFTAEGHRMVDYSHKHCLNDMLLKFAFSSIRDKKYSTLGPGIFELSRVKEVFKTLTMGLKSEEYPDAPVFMYHGRHDEIIPQSSAEKTARSWCKYGAQIKFMTYEDPLMEHLITEITGSIPAFEFVRDRINGHHLSGGCEFNSEYSLVFKPDVLGGNADEVISAVLDVFGNKIGPAESILASKKTIVRNRYANTTSIASGKGRYHLNSKLISSAHARTQHSKQKHSTSTESYHNSGTSPTISVHSKVSKSTHSSSSATHTHT